MNLTGKSIIAGGPAPSVLPSSLPPAHFTARGTPAKFEEAAGTDVNRAFEAAEAAFEEFRRL